MSDVDRRGRRCANCFLGRASILLVCCAGTASAAGPKVTALFPAGVARGQKVAVTAAGEFSTWPLQAWVDGPGLTFSFESDKGKLTVAAAADTEPGVRWIRFYDAEGASSPRPFVIGLLEEAEEVEPNNAPGEAQAFGTPRIVNGRLNPRGDVDSFAYSLSAGQTLVAALDGHSELGSPMDAVLQVCDARRVAEARHDPLRKVEAFVLAQDDDSVGLDPRIVFVAPRAGVYVIRTFAFGSTADTSIGYSGGDAFIYRLTLTTGGFIDHVEPLAVAREQSAEVSLVGWNLEGAKLTLPPATGDREIETIFRPQAARAIPIPRVDVPVVMADDSASPAKPQRIALPAAVSGRLAEPGRTAGFEIDGRKGTPISLRLESRSRGLPLDGVLRVLDADGNQLIEADDVAERPDPELVFNPPQDGTYRVTLHDIAGGGGPRFAYLLKMAPASGDFRLSCATDSVTVEPGKNVELPITIAREQNLAAKIDVQIEGLPPGVFAAAVVSEPSGETAAAVKLMLVAEAGAAPYSGPLRVVGGTVEPARRRTARLAAPNGPADLDSLWLTVTKAP